MRTSGWAPVLTRQPDPVTSTEAQLFSRGQKVPTRFTPGRAHPPRLEQSSSFSFLGRSPAFRPPVHPPVAQMKRLQLLRWSSSALRAPRARTGGRLQQHLSYGLRHQSTAGSSALPVENDQLADEQLVGSHLPPSHPQKQSRHIYSSPPVEAARESAKLAA